MFDIIPSKYYKGLLDDEIINEDGKVPFVTTTVSNQGELGYSNLKPLNPSGTISASDTTDHNAIFYRSESYIGRSHVQHLQLKVGGLTNLTGLYMVTAFKKGASQVGYSYAYKFNRDRMNCTELELPILSPEDTTPYWDYMAYFIHNIQQQYADKLEAKSEYELNLMCQLLGVTREDIAQRVEFKQPQYTNIFTVGELFEVKSTKKAINKNTITEFNGKYPYVTRKEGDNGIDSYINEDEQYLNPGNTISLAMDTYVLNYQEEPYFTGNRVKIVNYKGINKENALYIITALNKTLGEMTWGETMNMDRLNKIELELPVLAANTKQIDWGAIRHAVVGGGYQLSGYSSRDMQQRSCDNQEVGSVNLPQPIYKEFKLKDLFTSVKRGTRLVTADRVPGNTPLITAGETNQGVSQYIQHNTELFPANTLTIDMFGNVFYRGFEFFADDNIIVLNNPKLTRRVLNYIKGALFWLTSNYSYAKQFRLKEMDRLTLTLPVTTADDSEPNWVYMEEFIKESEVNYLVKQVIQAQRTIEQIRQII